MKSSEIELIRKIAKIWKPPPNLTLSQWSDEYARLSAESSAEPGRWTTLAYQREPMDCVTNPEVETITWKKSARVGYTKIVNNTIGYFSHQDPCPIMVVQPTIEDAEGYSKDEIMPMYRDTPILRGVLADQKSKDSSNTILKKSFPGGNLLMVGANSPRGFRRVSVRILLLDEVDGYPVSAGVEGDQLKLAKKRTEYYWNRKIIIGSTPTQEKTSRVHRSFLSSDQRYYNVPCPYCNGYQVLDFNNMQWDLDEDGDVSEAWFICQHCKKIMEHQWKTEMVDSGKWIALKPFKGHAGFAIWAAYSYSPNARWKDIAQEYIEASAKLKERSDPTLMITFTNTTLGDVWKEETEDAVSWHDLAKRREPYHYGSCPHGVLFLTAGVDTQDNRLAVNVTGWGRNEQSWRIYYQEIMGDPANPEVWEALDEILYRDWPHACGGKLRIEMMAIDSAGHRTQHVYNYARTRAANVMAIVGRGNSTKGSARPVVGRPNAVDVSWGGTMLKAGVKLWTVGVDTIKDLIISRFRIEDETRHGYYHFSVDCDDTYFEHLTNENRVTVWDRGQALSKYRANGPVEELDTEVYSYAAAIRMRLQSRDWDYLENELNEQINYVEPLKPEAEEQTGYKIYRSNDPYL